MSVREYVGARYVPLFADPLTWDATRTYEPLTVVLYQGNSYTSRQAVPANIDITNTTYWAQTGNYNAQIEQYRAEVQTFDSRIEANADAISDEETARQNADTALQTAIDDEETARENADTALQNAINDEATARQTAINDEATARQTAISNEATARQNADAALQTAINELKTKKTYALFFGDSWLAPNNDSDSYAARDNGTSAVNHIKLGSNITVKNFADGGAGWYDATSNMYHTNFAGQISIASADSTFENADVSLVVCMGGLNDVGNNVSVENLRTGVINFITSAQNTFPNARIVIIGSNSRRIGTIAFHQSLLEATEVISKVATEYGLQYHQAYSWLQCDNTCWATDNYHPNNHGGYVLAAYIKAVISGSDSGRILPLSISDVKNGNTSIFGSLTDRSVINFNDFTGIIQGTIDLSGDVTIANNTNTTIEIDINTVNIGAIKRPMINDTYTQNVLANFYRRYWDTAQTQNMKMFFVAYQSSGAAITNNRLVCNVFGSVV